MTDFNTAQYEGLMAEITAGLDEFADKLNQIIPTANAALDHWYIPGYVVEAVIWLAEKSVQFGADMLRLFTDLLKGAVAPIYMFGDAWEWMDVRGSATTISSALSEQNLRVDDSAWSGDARDAYVAATEAQSEAAGRIGSIAGETANHLLVCAAAGLAFYVALAAVLVKLIVATVAAVVAFGSVVFSWAGAAIILEEAGVNTALIAAAVATLTAFLGAQATTMVSLHGEAVDGTGFPDGNWPVSNSGSYSDGSVRDGDADWSLA